MVRLHYIIRLFSPDFFYKLNAVKLLTVAVMWNIFRGFICINNNCRLLTFLLVLNSEWRTKKQYNVLFALILIKGKGKKTRSPLTLLAQVWPKLKLLYNFPFLL